MYFFFIDKELLRTVSNHPVHILNEVGNFSPSSFIPFCYFGEEFIGAELKEFKIPVCNIFKPRNYIDQLCYETDLQEIKDNQKIGKQLEMGLTLVLDYNEDRSLQISSEEERVVDFSKGTMNFDDAVQSIQGVSAKVHIGTLSPFTHFGGGIYPMTVVKNMRATDAFLEMPLAQRNCKVELYEDCRTRQLLRECNCVPWEFPGYQVNQSKKPRIGSLYIFSCRPGRYAAQRAGTALSRTRQRLSTAALPVRGCMLTLIGKLQK